MELSIKDRIQLAMILPKEANMIEMMVIKSMNDKIILTTSEIEECEIKIDQKDVLWKKEKIVDIQFSQTEIKILKDSVKKMDESKLITLHNIDLCVKINSL